MLGCIIMSSITRKRSPFPAWLLGLAGLIAAGAFVEVPLGPVPFSLQTYAVTLAGFVLGPAWGLVAVALYLLAGLVGLPVFAGGTSGLGRLLGPTGGFLFSFLLMAALCGMATRDRERMMSWAQGLGWGVLGLAATFLLGVPWLALALDLGWRQALAAGMLPFLPGGVVKLVLAVATYRLLARRGWLPA